MSSKYRQLREDLHDYYHELMEELMPALAPVNTQNLVAVAPALQANTQLIYSNDFETDAGFDYELFRLSVFGKLQAYEAVGR